MFASQYLAYEALSEGMKRLLPGLRAWHRGTHRAVEGLVIAHGTGRGTAIVYTATKKAGVNDGQFI